MLGIFEIIPDVFPWDILFILEHRWHRTIIFSFSNTDLIEFCFFKTFDAITLHHSDIWINCFAFYSCHYFSLTLLLTAERFTTALTQVIVISAVLFFLHSTHNLRFVMSMIGVVNLRHMLSALFEE